MTYPPPPPPPPGVITVQVHEPEPADAREDKVKRKAIMWDRVKVLVILGVLFLMFTASKHSQIPIMSWGEAFRDQLRAKWWMAALAGVEVLRQIHYLISERSEGWHKFWQRKVFGGWERRMSKMNAWNRFRLQRTVKRLIFLAILAVYFGSKWRVSPWEALVDMPRHFQQTFFEPMTGNLPLFWTLIVSSVFGIFSLAIFYSIFFFDSSIETFKPGEIKTRFADVWGQDPVLRRVKETVDFLDKPEEIEKRGGHVPGGILLWGPPGTGKTLMAEAMAGETGRPYVFVDPSAFIQTFIGVAPMKVRFLYSKLRKLALRHGGVIVFFDEADSLGSRGQLASPQQEASRSWEAMHCCNGMSYVRASTASAVWENHLHSHMQASAEPAPRRIVMGGMGMGAGGGALQALLTQMSGLKKPRGFLSRRLRSFLGIKPKQPPKYRILHVFATNQPNALDQAMLRPGRIDRQYHVGYPHSDGRRRTFEGYLNKIKHEIRPDQVERLAVITPYFSGAKIKDIVNEAVIVSMRDGREVVTWSDILKAKYHKGHGEADDWTYGTLEGHQVALHEASHAVAMYILQKRSTIDVATIERRGGTGGFVQPIPLEERFMEWKSEHEIDAMTFLASLAGERMFFDGDNSAGVAGDMRGATSIVLSGMAFQAMGNTIASRGISVASLTATTSKPEDGTDRAIWTTSFGELVESKLQELLERVRQVLHDNRRFVFAVAHALETHKTITGDDIDAIYRGVPGPTLDGWMYHTDEFLMSYEAYHLSMLDAHKRQERGRHQLPQLALLRPVATVPSNGYANGYGYSNGHNGNGAANGNGYGTPPPQSGRPAPPPPPGSAPPPPPPPR